MTRMSIGEEQVECPLCMEPLEMDDTNFFPCTCGYQICRFCWHRIRTDENGLCPACRKAYPEDPAEFKPLTDDELQRIKKERKLKDLQRRQRAAENRKHLANVRVVQKNLVFAVGLSQRLGDVEMLKKHDYFGKFGKIVKVVINQTTSYAGAQVGGPSASAYITYQKPEDALRAIQAVNNIHVDGRTLKASLGTTKYCSHFLKGTQCPKPDCMYLHELGEESASFTKDEMQQGKHQEYEQKLYETYMNHVNSVNLSNTESSKHTQPSKSRKKANSPNTTVAPTISPPLPTLNTQHNNKEAWPSLTSGQTNSEKSTEKNTDSTAQDKSKASQPTSSHSSSPSSTPTPAPTQVAPSASTQPTPNPTQKPPSLLDMPLNRPPGLSNSIHRAQDKLINRGQNVQQQTYHTEPTVPPPPLLSTLPANRLPHTTHSVLGGEHSNSLFGDASDNMSLFGLSGFTRKPPVPATNPLPVVPTQALTEQIPDSINVSTATDWSAAFGFKPAAPLLTSSVPAHAPAPPAQQPIHTSHVNTDTTDDDLGFDPWNESTKALQDLIEKESTAPNRQTEHNSTAAERPSEHSRSKHLPPGFAHNQVHSAFPHNPLLGGSRMIGLMGLPAQQLSAAAAPPAMDGLHVPHGGAANGGLHAHYGGAGSQSEPFTMHDWQEGLRALLPNINISFGSNQQQTALQQQRAQANATHKSWDLSWDPAVVTTGNVSAGAAIEQNGTDEPHWMASLHHLTEEPASQPVNHKLLSFGLRTAPNGPGFINPAVTTPPPGFQHPVRTQTHPLLTDQAPHPLADTFQ